MRSFIFTTSALLTHALAADYRVTLGISQLTGQVGIGFDPNRIVPAAGDTITFTWSIPSYIQNPPTGSYSAVQGSYGSPCQPLAGGFDSGVHTTAPESAGSATQMVFQVKDTQPLYFYSSVGDQCKQGMVLGVNSAASGDGSVESYIIAAGGNPYPDTNSTQTTTPATNSTQTTTPATNSSTKTNSSTITSTNNSTSKTTTPITASNATASARANSAFGMVAPQGLAVAIGLIASACAY
ncbi:hypothetical protein CROQUDRAFT_653687 [Cronartium quercuum f. sp. fusiforme G11]|uniref:Extracellular serine-rich protein n=1 Tax=Cronartium quercuum f. sp. fusiforme G11 TaxID=708437 RepID=A0A9P6NSF7_9BASI|nr:hypothetical protein CROQUDRAFT_653687 [Cronartium quercuum f. sp. fusiforme G11]